MLLEQLQFDYTQNYIASYKLCFSLEIPEDFEGDLRNIPSYFDEKEFFSNSLHLDSSSNFRFEN